MKLSYSFPGNSRNRRKDGGDGSQSALNNCHPELELLREILHSNEEGQGVGKGMTWEQVNK